MILTKEQALKVANRKFGTVFVPELDGELRLASLSAGAALNFAALQAKLKTGEDVSRESMVVLFTSAIVDEKGAPLFDATSAGAFVDSISSESLQTIIEAIPGVSTATKAAAEVGAPLGNSPASPAVG